MINDFKKIKIHILHINIKSTFSSFIKDKDHWTKFRKEKLLEWEKRNDGSIVNATEYFRSIGEL